MELFDVMVKRGGANAVRHASRFFHSDDRLWHFLRALATHCEMMGLDYAISGDISLVFHGHFCTQGRVELLLDSTPSATFSVDRFDLSGNQVVERETGLRATVAAPRELDGKTCIIDGIRVVTVQECFEQRLAKDAPVLMELVDSIELIRSRCLTAAFRALLSDRARIHFLDLCIRLEVDKKNCTPSWREHE